MTYEEFEKLDDDVRQKLIRSKGKKKTKEKYVRELIGSGHDSMFIMVKRGERLMLSDGTIVRAGITKEEQEEELESWLYGKPRAFVRKMKRKINERKYNL